MIDATHDIALESWVASANGHHDFPIQNLPFGLFSPPGEAPRPGVAIGDHILELQALVAAGMLRDVPNNLETILATPPLRKSLRQQLSRLLSDASFQTAAEPYLHFTRDCIMHLPVRIGDYTDFYVGIHHATRVGALFRPDSPLLPNYKHVPIGYHGRASSVRVSCEPVVRPRGQTKAPEADTPSFGPSKRLDFELELGVWVGPGNALGDPIAIADAPQHIGGFCLLNDWSARDFQAWEYQPLGPFLAKNFHTTVSAWIVTPEALAPFRAAQTPRPEGDPRPLPYLWAEDDQAYGGLSINLEVSLHTAKMRQQNLPPVIISRSHTRHMYWTVAQILTHHASNGCNLQPGDLLGTGTLSGPDAASSGSLLELSNGGKSPIILPSGETRTFLEDGDEITLSARASTDGFAPIGFGECRGTILAARP
jgi:fumarylacetoacetase